MARPLSVSDEEVLLASERVAARVGTQGLTVSEVAREVGLTRAAITLRFAGADALKRLVMERKALQFEETIGAMKLQHGAAGLLAIAEMLGTMLRGREQFSNFWLRYSLDLADPVARSLEMRRGAALRALIAAVMPETAIDRAAAADGFMALMTGSMLNWQSSDHPDAAAFLRERALDWIRLGPHSGGRGILVREAGASPGAGPIRRWRRRLVWTVLVLLAIAGGAAAYVFRPIPVDAPAPLATLGGTVAQGKYLATIGNCAACHTTPGGTPYAGGVKFETPFGTLYSTNITPHRENGIGAWTFAGFRTAMKHGLRPDGAHLYPAFPYTSFARMTDADIASLYLYFRSIPAVAQANRANRMDLPFGNRSLLFFWNRLFHTGDAYQPEEQRSAQWNRGGYLVDAVAHCGACHTPRNMLGVPDAGTALHGGVYVDQVRNGAYRQWAAVDLTPGSHGLKRWSAEDIVGYLVDGKNPHAVVHGPMSEVFESTRQLTRSDATAIATYLHTMEPSPARFDWSWLRSRVDEGEIVYTVHCGTCHLPTGKGDRILGVALANNPIVQAKDPSSLINVILYGPDLPGSPFASNRTTMKPFGKRLSDEDVASVATYLRSSFGNNAPQVLPEQVRQQR